MVDVTKQCILCRLVPIDLGGFPHRYIPATSDRTYRS